MLNKLNKHFWKKVIVIDSIVQRRKRVIATDCPSACSFFLRGYITAPYSLELICQFVCTKV